MENMISKIDVQLIYQKLLTFSTLYVPKLILALITLLIGLWLVKVLNRVIMKAMALRSFDESLKRFLISLISISLRIVLLITVASMIGVEMTSFVALMGAAGLAVGLSLQGSMSNFAGGVLILLFRPFKIGDYIEAQGFAGTIKEIQIFYTILKTPDNRTIIIPNGELSNGNVINYSTEETRRVDFTFGISYDDDIKKAKEVLFDVVKDESRILQDPVPAVRVGELGDSSVNFVVRVWVKTSDYWDVFFDLTEEVKLSFDKAGISIPYPQQDVHFYRHNDDK